MSMRRGGISTLKRSQYGLDIWLLRHGEGVCEDGRCERLRGGASRGAQLRS